MPGGDLWYFERFATPYAWSMPHADPTPLRRALGRSRRPADRVVDLAGGNGRAVRAVDAPDRLVIDAAAGMFRRVPAGIGALRGDATTRSTTFPTRTWSSTRSTGSCGRAASS